MFFFGAPWRSTDYEQASDRIWRIGQTDPVDIVNVKLKSSKKKSLRSDAGHFGLVCADVWLCHHRIGD